MKSEGTENGSEPPGKSEDKDKPSESSRSPNDSSKEKSDSDKDAEKENSSKVSDKGKKGEDDDEEELGDVMAVSDLGMAKLSAPTSSSKKKPLLKDVSDVASVGSDGDKGARTQTRTRSQTDCFLQPFLSISFSQSIASYLSACEHT